MTLIVSAEDFIVLANTYVSGGVKAIVNGNVIAKTYAPTGNGSTIHCDFRSGDILAMALQSPVMHNRLPLAWQQQTRPSKAILIWA
jgi:hypothetical protein